MEIKFNDYRKKLNEWCQEQVFDTVERGEELFVQSGLNELAEIEQITFIVGDLAWCSEMFWQGLLDNLVEKFDLESIKNNISVVKPEAQPTYDYIIQRYFDIYESRKNAEIETDSNN